METRSFERASSGRAAATLSPGDATPGLRRDVAGAAVIALVVNSMVGAGILGLPARVDALVGAHAFLAVLACGAVVAAIALCFAEVSSRFEGTGGPYLYVRDTFGDHAGFVVGWVMLITRFTTMPVLAHVFADYAGFFWPAAAGGLPRAAVLVLSIAAMGAVNLWGVRHAATLTSVLTLGKLIPLALFVGIGAFFVEPQRLVPGPAPEAGRFVEAVILLLFAFSGFEIVTVAAGEIREPRRSLPVALVAAIAIVTALYLGILLVCRGTLPGLADSTRPLADASARFLGAGAAAVITLAALVSVAGTMCGSMLCGPRLFFAMASDRSLPAPLARVHPRWHTPDVAIATLTAVAIVLALTGTFRHLLGINVLARLVAYLGTVAAMLVLRRRGAAPFAIAAGPAFALVAAAACVVLIARSRGGELRDFALAIVAGVAARAVLAGWRRWRVQPAPVGNP